jgi:phosphorylcholine metabolism protein LicD
MINITDKVLKESKVVYWIDFGTLLGAFRNGKVISHDHDIDFCFIGE